MGNSREWNETENCLESVLRLWNANNGWQFNIWDYFFCKQHQINWSMKNDTSWWMTSHRETIEKGFFFVACKEPKQNCSVDSTTRIWITWIHMSNAVVCDLRSSCRQFFSISHLSLHQTNVRREKTCKPFNLFHAKDLVFLLAMMNKVIVRCAFPHGEDGNHISWNRLWAPWSYRRLGSFSVNPIMFKASAHCLFISYIHFSTKCGHTRYIAINHRLRALNAIVIWYVSVFASLHI